MEVQAEAKGHTEQQSADGNVAFDEPVTGDEPCASIEQVELGKKKKVPRRIIHFIDGDTLEEYSTDEEEDEPPPPPSVDPNALDWLPWLWFWLVLVGSKSLAAADFLGEKLAWFFGITSPKYQYVIDEYYRMKLEDAEDERLEQEELDDSNGDLQHGGEDRIDLQTTQQSESIAEAKESKQE